MILLGLKNYSRKITASSTQKNRGLLCLTMSNHNILFLFFCSCNLIAHLKQITLNQSLYRKAQVQTLNTKSVSTAHGNDFSLERDGKVGIECTSGLELSPPKEHV